MSEGANAFAREIAVIVAEELKKGTVEKALYTTDEASVFLACSRDQVANFVNEGKLRVVRIDSRPRFHIDDLRRFVKSARG